MPTRSSSDAARGSSTREHGLHRRDGDGQLLVVGLAGRELLEHACPGHISVWTQGLRRLRPAHLMTSKLRPAISGTPRMREASRMYHSGRPIGAKTKMATIITISRKLVPQRGCSREKRWAFSGVSGEPGLVAGDRLVLGAVELEHAPQVGHAGDQHDVAEEDRGPHDALDQPEEEGGAELVLEQAGEPDRDDEEEADGEHERDEHGAEPHRAGDRLLLLVELRVGRHAERLEADVERLDERDDAADDRQAERAVALGPGDERERLHVDLAVGLADAHRPGGDAAHHHALHDGLAAYGSVALEAQEVVAHRLLHRQRRPQT